MVKLFEQAEARTTDLEQRMVKLFEQAEAKATERHLTLMNSFDLQSRMQRMEAELRRLERERRGDAPQQQ